MANIENKPQENGTIQISEILRIALTKWYWFVISVALCLIVATFMILRTTPVYQRHATILIKETNVRRATTNDLESVLANGGMGAATSKLVNEVAAFKSPQLMGEVVKRLKLNIEFAAPGRFHETILYGNTCPINIDFLDEVAPVPQSFKLSRTGENRYAVSELKYSVLGAKKPITVKNRFTAEFGDTLSTPAGKFVLSLNPLCKSEWKDDLILRKTTVLSATRRFLSRFTATELDVKNRSDILNLAASDVNTARADDVLNMVINIYNENWVEDRNKVAISTSRFIKERLETIEKELGHVDEDIAGYKSANLIPDVKSTSSMYVSKSVETERQIQEAENELYLTRYIKNYLVDNIGAKQLIPMSGSLGNSGISSQITSYNNLLLSRNNMAANSSELNPLVLDMDASLESMKEAILNSVENQIKTLEAQVNLLHSTESKNTAKIAASPTQAKYLLSVERQQKVKESLYLYLLQKREENELSQAFAAYNTRLITPPFGGGSPISPKKSQIILIALLLGLCLPLASIYVKEMLNTTVRGRKDIENLNVPFLGEIPQYRRPGEKKTLFNMPKRLIRKRQDDPDYLVIKPGSRDIINEAFRVLRANLEFMTKGENGTVTLVTSFNPGSGKSFISTNVAAVLAIKKKKVLIIDGDLRRASVSKIVDSPEIGLSDYLAGQENDINAVIVPHKTIPNLCVLPVGTIPPNPSELIGDERFQEMILSLKEKFDAIFIDCPPIDIVADTQTLSSFADRTIFVARAGILERTYVPEIDILYEKKRFPNISLILNGTEVMSGAYAKGGKNHYYGYSYSKSYGEYMK